MGNKTDLASRRAISTLQGLRASQALGAEFVELSAKDNRVIPQSTEYDGVLFLEEQLIDNHITISIYKLWAVQFNEYMQYLYCTRQQKKIDNFIGSNIRNKKHFWNWFS